MPYKENSSNTKQEKGSPSATSNSKAEIKDNTELHEDIEQKYTDGPDEVADNVPPSHPNRNRDKDRERE